jgi:hypothetical protein
MKINVFKFAGSLLISFFLADAASPQTSIFQAEYISTNHIKMWVNNYGEGSHNPYTDGPGFYWPSPSDTEKTLIYSDGLFWMGKVGGEIYGSGQVTTSGTVPGIVSDENTTNVNDTKIYKAKQLQSISLNGLQANQFEVDVENWAAEIGAPYFDLNNDGKYNPEFDKPQIYGDEMLWMVFHDNDPMFIIYPEEFLFKIGMEIHSTIFAFKSRNLLWDVIFKKYKLINKGTQTVDSMYFSYYSDPDIGDPNDDYVGSDSVLSLAYAYNASSTDGIYGSHPPAVGYALLQGPVVKSSINDSAFFDNKIIAGYRNLDASSFNFYIYDAGYPGEPIIHVLREYWNFVRGLLWDGTPSVDPHLGTPTKFPLSGDPYRQTGWYEGAGWPGGLFPYDRRMILNCGPFTMAPGDTQEVVYAILAGQGSSNTASVEELKKMVPRLQYFHKNYSPPVPEIKEEKKQLDFKMTQNYPNPFNSQTVIHYQIPLESRVIIKVYDVLGNEVALLKNELQKPGDYQTVFNANNLASGIYILNISAREFFSSRKMILLR